MNTDACASRYLPPGRGFLRFRGTCDERPRALRHCCRRTLRTQSWNASRLHSGLAAIAPFPLPARVLLRGDLCAKARQPVVIPGGAVAQEHRPESAMPSKSCTQEPLRVLVLIGRGPGGCPRCFLLPTHCETCETRRLVEAGACLSTSRERLQWRRRRTWILETALTLTAVGRRVARAATSTPFLPLGHAPILHFELASPHPQWQAPFVEKPIVSDLN